MVQQHTPAKSWTKTLSKYSVAVLLFAAIGGCAQPIPFQHNAVAVLPMGSLERDWFVDLEATADPVVNIDVRDKMVFITTASKHVVALDRKAGTLKMSMNVSSPLPRLMKMVELKDKLVFPNPLSLEVFDSKGFFQMSISLPIPLRGNASGDNDSIYFGSVGPHGGLVESYDLALPYPHKKWEFLTRDEAEVTAGTVDYTGIIYSGSTLGEVNAVTGARDQIWETDHGNFLVSGPIVADLQIDESGLYVASQDSKLYCINRSTGKLKWQYFAGAPLTDSPVNTSDTIYQLVPGLGLAAIDKNAGAFNRSPRWVHPTATQFLSQDEKYVYLADPRPNAEDPTKIGYAIIAVDKLTMKQAFESSHKDYSIFGVNKKDSTIFAGFADGKIFAIKPVLKGGEIGEMVMSEVHATAISTN